jgi:hypothetical protein
MFIQKNLLLTKKKNLLKVWFLDWDFRWFDFWDFCSLKIHYQSVSCRKIIILCGNSFFLCGNSYFNILNMFAKNHEKLNLWVTSLNFFWKNFTWLYLALKKHDVKNRKNLKLEGHNMYFSFDMIIFQTSLILLNQFKQSNNF